MLRFELKKIFEKRLNVVAMIVGYVVLALCLIVPIHDEAYYFEDSAEYISGIEAIEKNRELATSQTDYLTEEFVTDTIREIQSKNMDLESDEGYMEIFRPTGDLVYYLANSYMDITYTKYDTNILNRIDLTDGGADFYETRMQLIKDHLNKDWSFGNYTEREKEYWISKAQKVTQPFQWGDRTVPKMVLMIFGVAFYQLFVIAICIAPVFAAESESGATQLLLTTRYGKKKLVWTKALASFIFAFGYLILSGIIELGVIGVLFGLEDMALPIQLIDAKIPYELTLGKACALQAGVCLLIAFFVTAFVMIFSALTKSSLATMALTLTWLIAPAFFPGSKTNDFFNHINYLFAVRFAEVQDVLKMFIDYQFGNIVIDYITMAAIVHLVLGILLLIPLRKVFVGRIVG